jgi:hypothetical protein
MIKKQLLYTLLLICSIFPAFAQEHRQPDGNEKEGRKKIKALYIAYISEALDFNEDESQRFWPIHKQYDTEMREMHQQNQSELEKEEALLNIKKKYKDRFAKVIGIERTNKFYKKDKEFRDKVIEHLKKKKMERMGKRNNP